MAVPSGTVTGTSFTVSVISLSAFEDVANEADCPDCPLKACNREVPTTQDLDTDALEGCTSALSDCRLRVLFESIAIGYERGFGEKTSFRVAILTSM